MKRAGPDGTDSFHFGSGGLIAFAAAPLSYVGWLCQPRSVLFLQFAIEYACNSH